MPHLSRLYSLCVACLLLSHRIQAAATEWAADVSPHARRQYGITPDRDANVTPEHLFHFRSRPDIEAPRWNVTVHDEAALASGYWFVAPYEHMVQSEMRKWTGPAIYDQHGELVWSGAQMLQGYNVHDFKAVKVNGQDMLSGIYVRGGADFIINNRYQIFRNIVPGTGGKVNIHDFGVVDGGSTSLGLTMNLARVPEAELASLGCDEEQFAYYPGFEERNIQSGTLVFRWSAEGHIAPNESYSLNGCAPIPMEDFLHANSIEKCPDGDYLLSARHTDTIYKISWKDGSIVWRFGGKSSDFKFPDHFSGQHDARVRSQNDTHMIISFLDNAMRAGKPETSNDQSRGMVVALHTAEPETAEVIQIYNHPRGEYAPGRGNLQILNNGNAFLGWWTGCLISEHSASDGKLLMEASWLAPLNSYRAYKFPWVGWPTTLPDVYAETVTLEKGIVETHVYVSWNGATEVHQWNLYQIMKRGPVLLLSVKRHGFETMLNYHGFLGLLMVEAIDSHAVAMAESPVVTTYDARTGLRNIPEDTVDEVLEEMPPAQSRTGVEKLGIIISGMLCSVFLLLAIKFRRNIGSIFKRRWNSPLGVSRQTYDALVEMKDDAVECLDDTPRAKQY